MESIVGISRLLLGLGFSAGFILVILSGAALFTEVNVLLPEMFLSRPCDRRRQFWRFWAVVYFGNDAGALFVGDLTRGSQMQGGPQELR